MGLLAAEEDQAGCPGLDPVATRCHRHTGGGQIRQVVLVAVP